jgi:hypothetical protein
MSHQNLSIGFPTRIFRNSHPHIRATCTTYVPTDYTNVYNGQLNLSPFAHILMLILSLDFVLIFSKRESTAHNKNKTNGM